MMNKTPIGIFELEEEKGENHTMRCTHGSIGQIAGVNQWTICMTVHLRLAAVRFSPGSGRFGQNPNMNFKVQSRKS